MTRCGRLLRILCDSPALQLLARTRPSAIPVFFETLLYLIYRDWVAKPGSTVVDIGANRGLHTFRLADCVGPKGVVHAFEPLPELADAIRREAEARYPEDARVQVHNLAAADRKGEITFFRNVEHASRRKAALSKTSLVRTPAIRPLLVEN